MGIHLYQEMRKYYRMQDENSKPKSSSVVFCTLCNRQLILCSVRKHLNRKHIKEFIGLIKNKCEQTGNNPTSSRSGLPSSTSPDLSMESYRELAASASSSSNIQSDDHEPEIVFEGNPANLSASSEDNKMGLYELLMAAPPSTTGFANPNVLLNVPSSSGLSNNEETGMRQVQGDMSWENVRLSNEERNISLREQLPQSESEGLRSSNTKSTRTEAGHVAERSSSVEDSYPVLAILRQKFALFEQKRPSLAMEFEGELFQLLHKYQMKFISET